MTIKQYDRVLMKDGSKASIVEIFEDKKSFIADIERNGDMRIIIIYLYGYI